MHRSSSRSVPLPPGVVTQVLLIKDLQRSGLQVLLIKDLAENQASQKSRRTLPPVCFCYVLQIKGLQRSVVDRYVTKGFSEDFERVDLTLRVAVDYRFGDVVLFAGCLSHPNSQLSDDLPWKIWYMVVLFRATAAPGLWIKCFLRRLT
jgi:hypothetical protein